MNPDSARRIAAALSEAGVFFVTLDRRPLLHPAVDDVLRILSQGGIRILATVGGAEEISSLNPQLPLSALLLDAAPFLGPEPTDFSRLGEAVDAVRARGCEPALFLVPQRDNLSYVPGLLSFCRERGIGRIKLPNTPVDDSFLLSSAARLPRPEDLERLKSALGEDPCARHQGLSLEVHDLFLWEVLFPGRQDGRSEYGGCQGGNSIAHVDVRGIVHPCSSWPSPLGSLLHASLADIWEGDERHRIRSEIASVPKGCIGCRDYRLCLGGCRGLALSLNCRGGRDPLCSGLR